MSDFLKQQYVKNDSRRKKVLRRVILRVQQISLVILVWSLFVGGIYGVYLSIFDRGIFKVKNIEVEGQFLHVSESDIKNYAGIKLGSNLFSVSLKKVQGQIAENQWVREVAVARKLPGTIWIYVSEYNPFAILANDELYIADQSGKVFKKAGSGDERNLPVITGFKANEDISEPIRLLNIFNSSPLSDYFEVSEVNFDKARGYSIVISNYGSVVRIGFDDAKGKFERLYSMIGAISAYKGKIKYVDLNIPGKVVVKYES